MYNLQRCTYRDIQYLVVLSSGQFESYNEISERERERVRIGYKILQNFYISSVSCFHMKILKNFSIYIIIVVYIFISLITFLDMFPEATATK